MERWFLARNTVVRQEWYCSCDGPGYMQEARSEKGHVGPKTEAQEHSSVSQKMLAHAVVPTAPHSAVTS